jgi:hypothetical protein
VINPNLEDQMYLSILTSTKEIINIVKIRTNFDELHSEIGHCILPKMLWVERLCHLCDAKTIENEKYSLKMTNIHIKF